MSYITDSRVPWKYPTVLWPMSVFLLPRGPPLHLPVPLGTGNLSFKTNPSIPFYWRLSWHSGGVHQIFIWAPPLHYTEVLHVGIFAFWETHICTHQLQIHRPVLLAVQFLTWCWFSVDRDIWGWFNYFVSLCTSAYEKWEGNKYDKNGERYNFYKHYLVETRLRFIRCFCPSWQNSSLN